MLTERQYYEYKERHRNGESYRAIARQSAIPYTTLWYNMEVQDRHRYEHPKQMEYYLKMLKRVMEMKRKGMINLAIADELGKSVSAIYYWKNKLRTKYGIDINFSET